MRAADNKAPLPPTSPPNFSSETVVENPQHAYRRRCQQGPMRVESSTMSDPSCGLQRAALGDECVAEASEGEEQQTTPTVDPRIEEEEEEDEMTKSVNLHRELATKRREVSHLVDEMQRLQSSINNLKEMSTSKIAQLQDMVSEKDRVIKDLAEKLLRQQDYTDLKRELRLLKALDAGAWQSWNSEPLETESPTNEKSDDTNGNRMTPPSGDESLGEEPAPSSTPPAADSASSAHLQRCLRLNVDRFGCEALNTLNVSRCVRELLSVNNIGQRLFAKLVLGLSQGTVSELLSRPKPWDKLTEKGRDSYRKMHAWACDQQCVMLLKAMLPKKGRDGKLENEDRQVQTASDVTTSLPPTSEDNNVSGSTLEITTPPKDFRQHPHHHPMGHTLNYTDIGNGKGLCHFAEFPPVMLAHLYQEELLKLIGKRMKDCQQPADQAKQAEEEIRRALSIYHRELTMMAAHQCHGRRPDSTTCGVPAAFACREPTCCITQPGEHGGYFPPDSMKVLSPYSTGSPLIPLPPEGGQQTISSGEDTSPLQRMQSITNSLLAAAGQGFGAQQFSQQRPSKAVLPPITQQQFDHYSNLNTEDIVKRVKEQLSQYSISQRLFGESVLGLSQGSVSDLLARPKPWHMLTQKGREPFIRMKMFLEDENAVHKLVASQYKIAPERLMRMGGYGGVPVTPGMFGANRYSPIGTPAEPSYPSPRAPGPQPKLPRPCSPPGSPSAPLSPSAGRGARGPFVQPSVYEMAAVTTDLDTQIITARIKETLTVHNIGQKLFGEAVLGLSQGSVSELLSKPKPWHMLSIKGREPFIRMQLWLNDPANVEKLQAIKTERREANKRRRNALDSDSSCTSDQQQPQAPCPMDASLFLYPQSSKKPRMLFSEEQKEALKLAYTLDPYPSTAVMEFLSAELGLSVRTITNWFHNHRMRLKQQNQEPDVPYPNPDTVPSTFDPIRFRLLLGQRLAEMCKASNQMLPYFSVPPFGVPQTVGKLDAENTLDLSISSQQYPKKDIEKEEEDRKRNSPKPSATTAIDLTDKNANTKEIDLTDSIKSDKYNVRNSSSEFSSVTSVKSSLDLSFTTLQKLAAQDLASSVTTTPADTTSRNSTPDIDSLFRSSSKQEEEFPVDLREDKRCNPINSGSNRRKPAAPQWVDPGLDLSPDSDIFEDDPQENLHDPSSSGQVINGICIRQGDSFQERIKQYHCRSNDDDKSRLEREQNIRRLERAIADHEEGWDDISDDDDDDDEVCL